VSMTQRGGSRLLAPFGATSGGRSCNEEVDSNRVHVGHGHDGLWWGNHGPRSRRGRRWDSVSDSDSDIGSGSGKFCAFAAEREVAEDEFSTINVFIPEEFEAAFRAKRDLIARAVDVAPGEIKGDMETVYDDFNRLFGIFEGVGFDAAQLASLDTDVIEEAEAAGKRIDAYIAEECGFDPDANETDGPTDAEIEDQLEESGNADSFVQAALEQLGLSADQSECLAREISLDTFGALAEGTAPDEVLDIFQDCGVSLEELARIGGGGDFDLGDGSGFDTQVIPDGSMDVIVDEFVKQGFTQDEAECLADSMIANPETAGDVFGALELCDIPLSRMAELGG
jgi:hypothetical protein